jgi:membrane-associated protease RseP (regulator of RpoE activity)
MEEGTEMSVDTIISGDSTKVIVRVMKRANLAEGQNLEDVMIHLDGLELPEGALSGEPHIFMFKGEGMGSDMVWNEATPGAGNAFFMASNKAILGVKLEKPSARDNIRGAFVMDVIPTSTAAALGLQVNDIIVAVDGQSVRSEQSMMDRMAGKKTGDPIEITYLRDGKKKKASGFLIPTSPAMGLPMGGMMHGMPGMHGEDVEIITGGIPEVRIDDSSAQNVEITEEVGENGEKRIKVIVIKKDGN